MKTKCLYPPCAKDAHCRGLCGTHYITALDAVNDGQTTWEKLESIGRAGCRRHSGSEVPRFQTWLDPDHEKRKAVYLASHQHNVRKGLTEPDEEYIQENQPGTPELAFNAHLEDAQRIAAELLVFLSHRCGWSDDEIDWTKVRPIMDILSQLEQVQWTVEAATGNRRPPLPVQPLTCKNAIVHGEDALVRTPAPVSRRWFSQPTREDRPITQGAHYREDPNPQDWSETIQPDEEDRT